MSNVVIYKTGDGELCVVHPSPEAVSMFGIDAIALKDVPAGRPYKIIESSELPTDRSQRDSWDFDDAIFADGIGSGGAVPLV